MIIPNYLSEEGDMEILGQCVASIRQTVSNTVSLLLYTVLKHTEARRRVQAEIDAAFANGPLVWEKLRTMRSLRGAMMETLRMYPVA